MHRARKLYTKGGFPVDSWQNSKGFMPRKGYDRGTIKKCRTSVWCGFPSSNRVWRSNNPLRWSPVLQHRRPPLQVFHESGRSTSLFSLCTIQNVRKGVRKPPPPFRTPFVPLSYPLEGTKGYERPRKGLRKNTLSLIRPKAPLSHPFRTPLVARRKRTKGGGGLSYNVIAKKQAKRDGKCFKTTLNGPSLNR